MYVTITVVMLSGNSVQTNIGSLKYFKSIIEFVNIYLQDENTLPRICTKVSMHIRIHGITFLWFDLSVNILNNTAACPISNVHARIIPNHSSFAKLKNDIACNVDTNAVHKYRIANKLIYMFLLLKCFMCI